MTRTFFALVLMATLVPSTPAQDTTLLAPVTMRGNAHAVSTRPGVDNDSSYEPPFCPPRTCLYYAGDFNSANSDANGLFNANYESGGLLGQVWVGVKPNRDATVTGATFVQFASSGYTLINPTPFAIQVGVRPGQAGKTICSTSGNATVSLYQYSEIASTYSFTIKKLSKPCKLKKGNVYYVNLLPTSDTGYGYLANVEDARPQNHHGWKNDPDDCYFNGLGLDYVPCDSRGPFSVLDIGLTGRE